MVIESSAARNAFTREVLSRAMRAASGSPCLASVSSVSFPSSTDMYLVTGGAGFIGSALVHALVRRSVPVVNVDKLTYAANPASLAAVAEERHYHFEHVDVCDAPALRGVFQRYAPRVVLHLAAESHVD